MKQITSFFKQNNPALWWRLVLGLIAANIVMAIATTLEPEVLRFGITAISEKSTSLLKETSWRAGAVLLLFLLTKAAVSALQVNVRTICQQSLSSKLIQRLIHLDKEKTDQYEFGSISTIIVDNINRGSEAISTLYSDFTAGVGAIVFAGLYMRLIEWRLALFLFVYYLLVRLVIREINKKLKKNARDLMNAEIQANNLLVSLLANMIPLRLSSHPAFLREKFESNEKQVMKQKWKQFSWDNGQKDFIWAAAKTAEYLIIYAAGVLVFKDVPAATLFSFIFASDIFNNGLYQFSFYWSNRASLEVYVDSFEKLMNEGDSDINEKLDSVPQEPFSITFDRVSFGYGDYQLLKNVSFTIEPGEKVLIKGGNGQGKSTLLKLILGLYRPREGRILFGETDISRIGMNDLSSLYLYISQNSHIFEGNVYENMALNHVYDREKADQILEDFKIHVSGDALPDTMSAGEKQRLNITRDFYRDKKTLVLADEIFSNVDPENRARIVSLFFERFRDATVCMITHDDIDYSFDRIFYVGNGKVFEEKPGGDDNGQS